MRVIGTLSHENQARRLSQYLTYRGVANSCEVAFDPSTSQMSYQIWIHDEDTIQSAQQILQEFEKAPQDPRFDAPAPEVPPPVEEQEEKKPPVHRFKAHLTHFLIALCAFLFFLNTLQEIPLEKQGFSEQNFLMTPLQALFLYDLPPSYEQIEQATQKNNADFPALKEEITSANRTPYWKGVYNWILERLKGDKFSSEDAPLFRKIREGQVWRLFSPCLLHQDLLHILFNMLWLWYLGRPIEERVGPFRMLLFTLIVGIASNTLQYLMSGPFFVGYSGVVTALAGFIWMRERLAPWEGYPLNRATILFLLIFVGAIFALQVASFFIQLFTSYHFAPNIANTAHIGGAVMGALLARSSFFAERVKR